MTTQPVFDPARSAAIRELLAETVAADRRRPDRTKFTIIAGLTALALALAGGTAALALTGVIHFGGLTPAPAPHPTSSATPTPAPTPTPTPSGLRVQVQPFPVLPHDVSALGTQTRWSLDLPGADDACRMRPLAYDLANGLTVFLTGTRPKEYEGGNCAKHRDENIGLTLVDTTRGAEIWSRAWAFTSPAASPNSYQFQILGTSGRALLDYGAGPSGPHEVIDLTTGKTVAVFDHGAYGGAVSVPGGSGDIVLTTEPSGNGTATITRVDPRDPGHPGWTTRVTAGYLTVADGTADPTTLPISYSPSGAFTSSRASIDLATGAVTTSPGRADYRGAMYFMTLWDEQAADGSSSFVGVDGAGARLWSRPATPGSFAVEVHAPGTRPGVTFGRASTGQLAIVDRTSVTVLDQLTGRVAWTTKGCATQELLGVPTVISDEARSALTVRYAQDTACSFDKNTGRQLAGVGIPFDDWDLFGQTNTYGGALAADTGTAYDNATGRLLWSLPKVQGEQWLFAGGYLVKIVGNRVESIG
jgi:hypothetical protein